MLHNEGVRYPKVIVFDLDNTLYDWVEYFVKSFYGMVSYVSKELSVSEEQLLDELREVHRNHSDTEHPFAYLEAPSILDALSQYNKDELFKKVQEFNSHYEDEKRKSISLYPFVENVLSELERMGVRLIAFTDSKYYTAFERMRLLNLFDRFTHIYCRPRASIAIPEIPNASWYNETSPEKILEIDLSARKPNPRILHQIIENEDCDPNEVWYVGDSMTHDIAMAKEAGMFAVWARYGTYHDPHLYERLVRVSHWTENDIKREKALKEKFWEVQPDAVLHNSLWELIEPRSTDKYA